MRKHSFAQSDVAIFAGRSSNLRGSKMRATTPRLTLYGQSGRAQPEYAEWHGELSSIVGT